MNCDELIRSHCTFSFQLGYVIYRRVLRYYSGEEDGLGESACSIPKISTLLFVAFTASHLPSILLFPDMRKALSRDVEKKSVIPLKRPVTPDELEYD